MRRSNVRAARLSQRDADSYNPTNSIIVSAVTARICILIHLQTVNFAELPARALNRREPIPD